MLEKTQNYLEFILFYLILSPFLLGYNVPFVISRIWFSFIAHRFQEQFLGATLWFEAIKALFSMTIGAEILLLFSTFLFLFLFFQFYVCLLDFAGVGRSSSLPTFMHVGE